MDAHPGSAGGCEGAGIPPQYHPGLLLGPVVFAQNGIGHSLKRDDVRSTARISAWTAVVEYHLWRHPEGGSPPGVYVICYVDDTLVVTAENDIPTLERKVNTTLEAMTHWIDSASSDGSVVHELVQLNESFNWTNWTSSQFWNELVHSFTGWTTLEWTLWLWWTDDWIRIRIRIPIGIFIIFLKWKIRSSNYFIYFERVSNSWF